MAATRYHEHEQGFAHPKYACTAGYSLLYTLLMDLVSFSASDRQREVHVSSCVPLLSIGCGY